MVNFCVVTISTCTFLWIKTPNNQKIFRKTIEFDTFKACLVCCFEMIGVYIFLHWRGLYKHYPWCLTLYLVHDFLHNTILIELKQMLGGRHGSQFAQVFSANPQSCSLLKLLVSKKVTTASHHFNIYLHVFLFSRINSVYNKVCGVYRNLSASKYFIFIWLSLDFMYIIKYWNKEELRSIYIMVIII